MAPDQAAAAKRWTEGSQDAFETAEQLFKSKKYQHALFFCHLATEKALKARFIATQNKLPPYTHDLPLLAERQGLKLTDNQSKTLDQINTFNIAGRYHEEKLALYEKATAEYAQRWIENTKEILTSILHER